ncbi:hypothetical protein H0H93_002657 [Arthromyces matolae]|nr:hypothetical protein H0H93_002657 [Arthromyces matolae]
MTSCIPLEAPMILPHELIETIMDNADDAALIKFSLVSRIFSNASRRKLFYQLSFNANRARFANFLALIESPVNTIATNVCIIYMHRLFNYRGETHEFRPRDPSLLASTLTRLTTLRLSLIEWATIPGRFATFLLALPVRELELAWFTFQKYELVMLLKSPLIARTSQNLSFYDLRILGNDYGTTTPSQLPTRTFHFKHCDLHSFESLKWVWKDFFDEAQVSFGTFHLRKHSGVLFRPEDPSQFTPALRLLGPSITSLCLPVKIEEWEDWEAGLVKGANFLHECTALTTVFYGPLDLSVPEFTFSRVLEDLERLPPSFIEESGFIMHTHYNNEPDILLEIPWVDLLKTLHNLFPRLKRIKFTIAYRRDDSTKLALAVGLEKVKSEILGKLIDTLPMQILFETYVVGDELTRSHSFFLTRKEDIGQEVATSSTSETVIDPIGWHIRTDELMINRSYMTTPTREGLPLPDELMAVILEFLSTDESKEISLTCKLFRSLSLPQLFSRFCFKPFLNEFLYVTGTGEITTLDFPLGQLEIEKAREILHFFTSPSICRHVRRCDVDPHRQVNRNSDHDSAASDAYIFLDEFFDVLPRFTTLRSLRFAHVPFTSSRLSQLSITPHHTLSLHNCTLPSEQHIPRIHAEIVRFSFDSKSKNGPMYQYWHHILDPDTLQDLQVLTEGETWQFFHSIPTFPHLTTLNLATGNDATCFHLPALLTKFPVLDDFKFSYSTASSHRRPIIGDANNPKLPIQRFFGPLELLHLVANPELEDLSLRHTTRALNSDELIKKLNTESPGLKNLFFFAADIQQIDADLLGAIRTHMPRLGILRLQVETQIKEMIALRAVTCEALSDSLEGIYLSLPGEADKGLGDALSCIERLMNHPALKSIFISERGKTIHLRNRRDASEKWRD